MKIKIAILVLFLILEIKEDLSAQTKSSTMWAPYIEWSIENKTYSGNPFDIIAKVRIKHQKSGKEHTTEMFYSGNDIWKFRFTGTEIGKWYFITESNDLDLNGKTGSIKIKKNNNSDIKGFLTHSNNQYSIWTGNKPVLSAYRYMVYMNGIYFSSFDSKLGSMTFSDSPLLKFHDSIKINSYLNDAKTNSFEIIFLHPGYPHVWTDGSTISNGENPRFKTFEILEKAIIQAHQRGMRIHLWMWGDQARKATPIPLEDGINGTIDKRLQRYIAARLGPLPGWSMGYGFDLHEWTNQENLNEWASYLHSHFGWEHLLSARGFVLKEGNNINSYDGFGRNVPLHTTTHGPKGYLEVLEDMNSDTRLPHLYEERHSYLRGGFKLDMDGTRRLIWWEMMAGGMGGWFGFYPSKSKAYQGGYPYPKPAQFRTAKQFWDKFYLLSMKPEFIDGNCVLSSSNDQQMILYAEDTDEVKLDLSTFGGNLNGVAIDTKKEYQEIVINKLERKDNSWKSPYKSDWVIVLGYN